MTIDTTLLVFIIGNIGGLLIGYEFGKDRTYTRAYDRGNETGIEWMVKLQSGYFDRQIQERQIKIAMETWF